MHIRLGMKVSGLAGAMLALLGFAGCQVQDRGLGQGGAAPVTLADGGSRSPPGPGNVAPTPKPAPGGGNDAGNAATPDTLPPSGSPTPPSSSDAAVAADTTGTPPTTDPPARRCRGPRG